MKLCILLLLMCLRGGFMSPVAARSTSSNQLSNEDENVVISSTESLIGVLHFSRKRINAGDLPRSFPVGEPFYRIRANTLFSNVTYNLLAPKNIVVVDSSTGELSLVKELAKRWHPKEELVVEVQATHSRRGSARVVVAFHLVPSADCSLDAPVCFGEGDMEYELTIDKRTPTGVPIDYMRTPLSRMCADRLDVSYSFLPKDILKYDEDGHFLRTTKHLYLLRGEGVHNITIFCNVTDGESSQIENRTVNVIVKMLAGRMLIPVEKECTKNVDFLKAKTTVCRLEVKNIDIGAVYRATLEGDDRKLFNTSLEQHPFPETDNSRVVVDVKPVANGVSFYPERMYTFKVVLEDVDKTHFAYDKITYKITLYNKTIHLEPLILKQGEVVDVFSDAPKLSRVLGAVNPRGWPYSIQPLSPKEWSPAFGITPVEGIIYVNDTEALHKLENKSVTLKVDIHWGIGETFNERVFEVKVNVRPIGKTIECDPYESRCSVARDKKKCEGICGVGAPNVACTWLGLNHEVNLTLINELHLYSTCTPAAAHCPDNICDELENRNPSLCPQDCARNVVGVATHDKDAFGIGRGGVGMCWCSSDTSCTCEDEKSQAKVEHGRSKRLESESRSTQTKSPEFDESFEPQRGTGLCGRQGCANLIKVLGLGGMLIVLSIVGVFILLKKSSGPRSHKGSHNKCLDASDIPSVFDPDSSMTFDSPDIKLLNMNEHVDIPWEYRRDNLLFENTLGEGEFGKVIKAQAWNIAGREGYVSVAVKMLKDDTTSTDEQDLLSELQMLKEVDHVNVIRLLGACTSKDGPLYVIVEFCEFGSLRSYLRKCRNISSTEDLSRAVQNPTYLVGELSTRPTPSPQQLTSYMWQVARGMSYLADMKVIHRDLATRNILLARDHVIKISDFGLSRDVYEGDTYLKRSRGRVPVKWMAIESLEDQIYTSKSDVWSFGVVLWEIITLGATPYPGVSGERLCHLLKQGYRMYQPEQCSDQLYAIMRDCWKTEPMDRPSFKLLASKFDRLLQDTTVYLDVEDGAATCSTYYNDDSVESEPTRERLALTTVEAALEGNTVKTLLRKNSEPYLNDEEQNRLLHYAKMDFARSSSESSSSLKDEHTSSV